LFRVAALKRALLGYHTELQGKVRKVEQQWEARVAALEKVSVVFVLALQGCLAFRKTVG